MGRWGANMRRHLIQPYALAIFLAVPYSVAASQGGMTHPFTYQELFEGLRRFFPDEEARQLATEAATPAVPRPGGAQLGRSTQSRETIDFTQDLLILMSFISEETRAKVEQWRRRVGEPSPAEQAAWNQRRVELMEWARDGYRRRPEG